MKSCKGYNLLEMLVALLVISIGLLGVATLQTRGQQFNYFAYMRTQSTFLAYDLMDRMRINLEEARKGSYAQAMPTSSSKDCNGVPGAQKCSYADLVEYDLYSWYQQVLDILPADKDPEITFDSSEIQYNITIYWRERDEEKDLKNQTWILRL